MNERSSMFVRNGGYAVKLSACSARCLCNVCSSLEFTPRPNMTVRSNTHSSPQRLMLFSMLLRLNLSITSKYNSRDNVAGSEFSVGRRSHRISPVQTPVKLIVSRDCHSPWYRQATQFDAAERSAIRLAYPTAKNT